ncbi:hypothetical protein CO008_02950 [Candidatus Roizmanbacteria bacterium CG_4_8_14_3_um_filter_36_12]|nr:MAG: hypothetical protein CO008_02950 [Candidatus Roizmanbacteria bacterium CG_4_8_14_3_um_filter_36_12]
MKDSVVDYIQAEELREFIEREVLIIIKDLAKVEGMTKEKIQSIARRTLELIRPGMNLEELYCNAVKLDDNYMELAPVVVKVMREYEQKYEKKALEQVTQLIKSKQFDQAQEMVKKVLAFKINN